MKGYFRFAIAFVLLLGSCLLLEQTRQLTEKDYYHIMLSASQRTQTAFEAVRAEKEARGHKISPIDDPNSTGLIGLEYTEITTTLGNLESKRTTTNPNFSAVIVDMLMQCGVKKGDRVCVNLSSSFPAANIAVLCALDAVGAEGVIISSVGASTYGGNIPDFTYLDMEHFLYTGGYIQNHTSWFSMGGINDQGKEMPPKLREDIKNRLTGLGLTLLDYDDLDENIDRRLALYHAASGDGTVACFINAGGNSLSFGDGDDMVDAKNGIIRPGSTSRKGPGLIPAFLSEEVPVLHLLNMKDLVSRYGLPIDPVPLPQVGSGGVYTHLAYNIPLAVVLLLLNGAWLIWSAHKLERRRLPF